MWRRVAYGLIGAALLGGFVILSTPASGLLADLGTALLAFALLAMVGLILKLLGPGSGSDRERESRARDEFDRTGRWPDE
ncbi:MAG TPA: hypothetical protein VHM72_08170 [Solirubrobacteraceae bacterium]|jgi:hypothetical protein|nr:hypothetical protein [Solirubrobacteraceae bacterium]